MTSSSNAVLTSTKLRARQCKQLDDINKEKPHLLKGFVKEWPIVERTQNSARALVQILKQYDAGKVIQAIIAPSEVKGHLHYNQAMTGFNFKRQNGLFTEAAKILMALQHHANPPSFYLGAKDVREYFPGVEELMGINAIDQSIAPNIWIGNRLTIATHNDHYENIACVVAGKRRFTLFPPECAPQLYIGPESPTPSGRPISMANVTNPDLRRFPKLEIALQKSQIATLEPGDALYIPTGWWHNVESLSDFNVLVNYWWR